MYIWYVCVVLVDLLVGWLVAGEREVAGGFQLGSWWIPACGKDNGSFVDSNEGSRWIPASE